MTLARNDRHDTTARRSDPAGRSGPMAFVRGIFGSAVMLVTAKGLEILFFGPGFFAALTQHPFWIIVLLAAILDGLYVGVATAALAALLMDWPPRPIGVDITAHYIDVAILPLQWLMAAICIGVYRHIELRQQAELRTDNAELALANETLAAEVSRQDAAILSMELAAATRNTEDLREGANRIAALPLADPDDIGPPFARAAAALTDRPCALLLVRRNRLVQVAGPQIAGIDLPCSPRSRIYKAIERTGNGAILELPLAGPGATVLVGAVIRDRALRTVGAVVLDAGTDGIAVGMAGQEIRTVSFLARLLAGSAPGAPGATPALPGTFAPRGRLTVVGGRGD